MAEQKKLLCEGFSFSEVAEKTNSYPQIVIQRNTKIFKVDIQEAFRRRIDRDGVPCRLDISDAFGYWFSGYFDGEGCLVMTFSATSRGFGRRLGVQVACRADDHDVLAGVHGALGVGTLTDYPAKNGLNPNTVWRCENAKDLGEVILPLFDRYPLRSKKAREYSLWRPQALEQYLRTAGGISRRAGNGQKGFPEFMAALVEIRKIRHMGE